MNMLAELTITNITTEEHPQTMSEHAQFAARGGSVARVASVIRPVVVYNPTSSEQEIRPLNEVASSHLARRCFIGNLYKQVKDPNLVGALSGHKDGSRAFVRYREIDEDMKRDLVSMLE